MLTGIELISQERQKQMDMYGFDADHDDDHSAGEIVAAAECYMVYGTNPRFQTSAPMLWPWKDIWYPTGMNQIRALTKAGALIAAEIDRLQRKQVQ